MKKIITAIIAAGMVMSTAASVSASAVFIDEMPRTNTVVCESKKPLKDLTKISPHDLMDLLEEEYEITYYQFKFAVNFVNANKEKGKDTVMAKVRNKMDKNGDVYWTEGLYRFMEDYWKQIIKIGFLK